MNVTNSAREASKQIRCRQAVEEVMRRAFAAADVKPDRIAVDVGCGSNGFITRGLVERGLRVIAVDWSRANLDAMQRNLRDLSGIEYQIGDAERLLITSGSVDYAFANLVLHHVERPIEVIREMRRAVRDGGKVIITDAEKNRSSHIFGIDIVRTWFLETELRDVSAEPVIRLEVNEQESVRMFAVIGTK